MVHPETERDLPPRLLRHADGMEVSGTAGATGAVLGRTSPGSADFLVGVYKQRRVAV